MPKFWPGPVALCPVALCVVALLAVPAGAQDSRSISDRLDRVERDLNQLQRQVYRTEVGGPAPSAPDTANPGGTLDAQIRMDQIEDQMRKLTGQLEELQYGLSQLSGRLDKMQSDNEVRFQQLEKGGGSDQAQAATPEGGAEIGPPAKPGRGAGDMDQPVSRSGTLTAPGAAAAPAAPAPAPATGGLPEGTAQAQYNYAFGLLRQRQEDAAEAAFKAFLQRHPNDPLAANAQYWLGEIYMERKEYKSAAAAFADGYQKAPQGAKAPDSLLKLGEALGNQGRKQDACFSFAKLERDFPGMAQPVRDRVARDKQQFGC